MPQVFLSHATALLALPWELLRDGDGYLFQGRHPIRVRRRLPNTRVLDLPLLAPRSASCWSARGRRMRRAAISTTGSAPLH